MKRRAMVTMVLAALAAAGVCSAGCSLWPRARAAPRQLAAPQGPEYRVLQQRPDRLIVELPSRLLVVAQRLEAAPVVSAQVWVKTGSIYEVAAGGSGAGLSHFLEHLVSGGATDRRTEAESNQVLGAIGARTNAGTGLATVRYHINTTSRHADQAIDLLSDWMQNSLITETEYARERDVIQREFQMGQGEPGRIFWKLTQQARYRSHPARHPTIGYLDEFLAVSRDTIADFYHKMYVPNNMIFVVVGDIDVDHVVEQVAGHWKDSQAVLLPQVSLPIEPPPDQPSSHTGSADVSRPRLRLAWPGVRLATEGDYALDLLASVLGQGESSRLVRSLRDEQHLVNTISAFNMSMTWADGFFAVDAEVSDADDPAAIERVRQAIMAEVERVRDQGVSDTELARARRKVKTAVVVGSQTAQGLAADLAGGLIDMSDPDYRLRYAEAIQNVSAAEIHHAAKKHLEPTRMLTLLLQPLPEGQEPQKLTRPPEDPAAGAAEVETVDLDNARISEGLLRLGDRDELRAIQTEPVVRRRLSNGLRLLIGRNTAVPAVAMQFYQLGGLLSDVPDREGVANATARLMMRGTTSRSADDIAHAVEDLGASLSTSCGNNTLYSQAICLAEDWPVMLGLMSDVLQNPAFNQEQWQTMQRRLLASIDRLGDSWSGELGTLFRQAYYRFHPWSRTVLGRREVVEKLTVADLQRFHRQRLGASEAVLAVFGDVDPGQVVERAEALFGALPAHPEIPLRLPDSSPPVPGLFQHRTQKPLAAVQIGYGPGVTRSSPDYPALRVMGNVLSDFPIGWLQQALRGKEGLAYAVWAYTHTGLAPGHFTLVFNTKPQTVAEALARSSNVVARARSQLVDDQTLARAKAGVLTSEFFSKQTNGDRAQEAALAELYGLGLDESQRFLERVEQVDAAKLRDVAQQYLRNPVAVVISHEPGDEQVLRQALGGEEQ